MIIDSSALLAILMKEPERNPMAIAIADALSRRISTVTLFEAAMVIEGRAGDAGGADLDMLIADLDIQSMPFTADHLGLAREAFRRFGKGRHSARLNFGDCISYALAKERGEPLLFKGDDFSRTDIEAAVY